MSKPRAMTKSALERAALAYLGRFAASAQSLRRVLIRRAERAAPAAGGASAEAVAMVDELISRFQSSGLLDDRLYAGTKSRALLRRGRSAWAIRQHLADKGVAAETIDEALGDLSAEAGGDAELAAALACARRRRLGPFRPAGTRRANRLRDLAALGRAGFSWDTARAVIDGAD
jgi:regulatory protein